MDDSLGTVMTIARSQNRCVTTRDCVAAGLSRKRFGWLVRHGHWQRVHRAVYVVHGGPPSWRERARAALLYAGPGAALSHDSAAYLRGLIGDPPRIIEVSVPASRTGDPSRGLRVHRRGHMPPSFGRLVSTSIEHTALDLVHRARSVDDVVGSLTEAYRRHASRRELRELVASRPRLRHRPLVTDVLCEADAGIESPLERRYHHEVERAHGLPRAKLQVARASWRRGWTGSPRPCSPTCPVTRLRGGAPDASCGVNAPEGTNRVSGRAWRAGRGGADGEVRVRRRVTSRTARKRARAACRVRRRESRSHHRRAGPAGRRP
ncbi:MAG: hypothetical protein GX593_07575 [Actinomycetales bacterium]|nr:hypothetical protein [Actinomycetales bacterium]